MAEIAFAGLPLLAAPGLVMTPRPASEALVAAARERLGGRGAARVADVGTGCGALAVAIAAGAPAATVWATDTSCRAVELARANVRRHRLDGRVFVRHGDLLDPVPGIVDLIVANLPYLPRSAAARHPELAGEPAAAVYAPGDGLGPYRRLLDAAAARLARDGELLLQLHRRVVSATRAELPALRAALAVSAWAAGVPAPQRLTTRRGAR